MWLDPVVWRRRIVLVRIVAWRPRPIGGARVARRFRGFRRSRAEVVDVVDHIAQAAQSVTRRRKAARIEEPAARCRLTGRSGCIFWNFVRRSEEHTSEL